MPTKVEIIKSLSERVQDYLDNTNFASVVYLAAEKLALNEAITILWISKSKFAFSIKIEEEVEEFQIEMDEEGALINAFQYEDNEACLVAGLCELVEYIESHLQATGDIGKIYSREGMKKRVLKERADKAKKLNYTVKLGSSQHGIHQLRNEHGQTYHIVIWDFEKEKGYIDNIDWRTNKLGTTKHIIFFFNYIKKHPRVFARLPVQYPFIDISLLPDQGYRIGYFYNRTLETQEKKMMSALFGDLPYLEEDAILQKYDIIKEMSRMDGFFVRQEVLEKIQGHFEELSLKELSSKYSDLDYENLRIEPFDYQKRGIEFCIFKKSAIIADEMGLGKTFQAISIAILKKQCFDFKRVLLITPASIKGQWKNEIEKFSNEKALIIQGNAKIRAEQYHSYEGDHYFYITNYESVRRDILVINKVGFDFVILDEGQRIKNYNTKTAASINQIEKEHGLVLSGTPIENKLLDLYSIMLFLDQSVLTPQWELSQQHCIFDDSKINKILGYYNLDELKQRIAPFIIRRQKSEVLDQLPQIIHQDVFVNLTREQKEIHDSYKSTIASKLRKRFKTQSDWDVIMNCLTNMRMVCDSTYLINKCTHISPKLKELGYILIEQLDIFRTGRKVIIFSEWTTMLGIIEDFLIEKGLTVMKLTGKVPVKKRQQLIDNFTSDPSCQIFLSSEAGGTGLNLQIADTVINFELPWNPAKKNQRIGRIDRIGQKSSKIHVFNLITPGTIETSIMAGLFAKQKLFDSILNSDSDINEVDFSSEGRAQFIKQLEELIESGGGEILETLDREQGQDEEGVLVDTLENDESLNQQVTVVDFDKMEEVLHKGMEFLSGIYQMSTGQSLNNGNSPTLDIDRETGEVTMKFKFKF